MRKLFITLMLFAAIIQMIAQNASVDEGETAESNFLANSALASGTWNKVAVSQTGIHRIPYATLRSWGYTNPAAVSVFGNGGKMVPRLNSAERPDDLPEIGVWHYKDALYFYAYGPVEWEWDSNKLIFQHRLHLWENKSYYFISDSKGLPKAIETLPAVGTTPARSVSSYDHRTYHEMENISLILSGRKWFGESFSVTNNTLERTINFQIPDRISSEELRISAAVAGRSALVNQFNFKINEDAFPALVLSVPPLDISRYDSHFARETSGMGRATAGNGELNVLVQYTDLNSNATGWLDYITINSRAALNLRNGELQFRDFSSVSPGETLEFNISNADQSTVIWDVSHRLSPARIALTTAGNTASFRINGDNLYREFVAFNPSATFPSPTLVGAVSNQNLHAISQAHYIIVAPDLFLSQALELAEIHRTRQGLNVEVVTPTQLYNEFSWGHTDPTAIRSFMRMFYERWGSDNENSPRYLLLFGHGSYDSRTEDPDKKSLVVTYQSENSVHITDSYVTDDYFGFLDPSEGDSDRYDRLDIGIGRIPARTQEEATIAVEKIKRYLDNQDSGNWRKLLTFLADDGDFTIHMRDADLLAEKVEGNYPQFDIRKIYLDNYKKTSSHTGERSPGAQNMVDRTIAEGTLLFNFVGHGGVNGLTGEQVITKAGIEKWSNSRKLPLFVTATCEFSRYDKPLDISAGERVLFNPHGGGIALLSTTRVVYSGLNFQLNNAFFNYVFERDEEGNTPTLGEIIKNTKNNAGNSVNKLNFSLLGDPALKIIYPQLKVKTTAINNKPLTDIPDTLKALSKAHIRGEITNNAGIRLKDYNGKVDVIVYDKRLETTTLGNGGETPFKFKNYSNILFKGIATVTNGEFEASFMIPYDIRYNYAPGKISYYARSEDSGEAFGAFKDVIIGGSSDITTGDNEGPDIELYLNHSGFKPGDKTGSSPLLYANIFDEAGINTSGNGIGHDIIVIINGETNKPIILNDYFQAKPDDYRAGSIIYQLPEMKPGTYELSFRAWDNYNNSRTASLSFVVDDTNDLTIRNFKWYPNPLHSNSTGYYSFETDEPNAALTITAETIAFSGTVAGRSKSLTVAEGNHVEGLPLPLSEIGIRYPGIYLVRFHIKSASGKETQRVEKIVVK